MKTVWASLGIFGGVCFLTMGLPVLLAVGLVGALSASVWLSLFAMVIGVVGLVGAKAISRRCRGCAAEPGHRAADSGAGERRSGPFPAERDEGTRESVAYATARER